MAKVSTSNFRTGMVIEINNELYEVIDYQHVKPGKGDAFLRTKLKGVVNEKNIEKIRVEHQPYQFLYKDGNLYYFMHQETYRQLPVSEENVKKAEFIAEGQ